MAATAFHFLPASKLQSQRSPRKSPLGLQENRWHVSKLYCKCQLRSLFLPWCRMSGFLVKGYKCTVAGGRCVGLSDKSAVCSSGIPGCAAIGAFHRQRGPLGKWTGQCTKGGAVVAPEGDKTHTSSRTFSALVGPPGYFRRPVSRSNNPDAVVSVSPGTEDFCSRANRASKATLGVDWSVPLVGSEAETTRTDLRSGGQSFVVFTQDRQITRKRLESACAAAALVRELFLRHPSSRRPPSILRSRSHGIGSSCDAPPSTFSHSYVGKTLLSADSFGVDAPPTISPCGVSSSCSSPSSSLSSPQAGSSSSSPSRSPSLSSGPDDFVAFTSSDLCASSLVSASLTLPSLPKAEAGGPFSAARAQRLSVEMRSRGHPRSSREEASRLSCDTRTEPFSTLNEVQPAQNLLGERRRTAGRHPLESKELRVVSAPQPVVSWFPAQDVCERSKPKDRATTAISCCRCSRHSTPNKNAVERLSQTVSGIDHKSSRSGAVPLERSFAMLPRQPGHEVRTRRLSLDETSSAVASAVKHGDFRLLNIMLTEALTRAVSPHDLFRLVWRFRKFLLPANVATALHALVKLTRRTDRSQTRRAKCFQPDELRKERDRDSALLTHPCVQLLLWHLVGSQEVEKDGWVGEGRGAEKREGKNEGTEQGGCLPHFRLANRAQNTAHALSDGQRDFGKHCVNRRSAADHECGSTKLEKLSARHLPVALWSVAKLLRECSDRGTDRPHTSRRISDKATVVPLSRCRENQKGSRLHPTSSSCGVSAAWIHAFLTAATRAAETRAPGLTLQGITMTAWALATIHDRLANSGLASIRPQCMASAATMCPAFFAMGRRLAFLLQNADDLARGERSLRSVAGSRAVSSGTATRKWAAGATGEPQAYLRPEEIMAKHTHLGEPRWSAPCSAEHVTEQRSLSSFVGRREGVKKHCVPGSEPGDKERPKEGSVAVLCGGQAEARCVLPSGSAHVVNHGSLNSERKVEAEVVRTPSYVCGHESERETLLSARSQHFRSAVSRTLSSFLSACGRLQLVDPTLILPVLEAAFSSNVSDSLFFFPPPFATEPSVGCLGSSRCGHGALSNERSSQDLAAFGYVLGEFDFSHRKTNLGKLETSGD